MSDGVRRTLRCQVSPASCLCLSADGKYGIVGCEDRTLRLFNPRKAEPRAAAEPLFIQTYGRDHLYAPLDVQLSRDSARMASCARDKVALLWDVSRAHSTRRLRGHGEAVHTVAFGGEGDAVLVTGSSDRTVRLWDLRSGSPHPIQVLSDARDAVSHARVCGTDVVAASVDGVLRTYDVRVGRLLADSVGEPITGVGISGAGDRVMLSCLDSTVRLLDRRSGRQLHALAGHEHKAFHLRGAFTCGDRGVVMGSEDGRVLFWDARTGDVTRSFDDVHGRAVTCAVSSSTDALTVSAAYDGTLQVYDAP